MIHPGDMAGKGPLGLKGAKPGKDRGHMARVAILPCVCCGAWPVWNGDENGKVSRSFRMGVPHG